MADEADLAARYEQQFIQSANAVRQAQYKPLKATGACFFCDESLATPGACFCDEMCREDYEFEKKVRAQRGLQH
jgi:hypothetical protein